MDRIEAIERLARLRDSGAITEAEFEAQKRLLLAGQNSGRRTGLVVAGAALLLVGILSVALLWQGDTESHEPANAVASAPVQANQAAPAPTPVEPAKPAAAPAPETRSAPAPLGQLTTELLIGHWTNPDSGDCSGGGGEVMLRRGGNYSTSEGGGRWRLEGSQLHMTNWGGAPARIALQPNGDLALTWDYGSEIWRRCPF